MRNLAMNDALGRGVDPVACSRATTQPRIFAMLTTGDLVRHACAILGAEPRHRGSDPAGRTSRFQIGEVTGVQRLPRWR